MDPASNDGAPDVGTQVLAAVLAATSDGVVVLDPRGRVVSVNDVAAELLGRPANGSPLAPGMVDGAELTIGRETVTVRRLPVPGAVPGGPAEVVVLHVAAADDHAAEELERVESTLRRQRRLFSAAYTDGPFPMLVILADGTIVDANAAAVALFGDVLLRAVGQPLTTAPMWTSTADRDRVRGLVVTAATGRPIREELTLRDATGADRVLELTIDGAHGGDGAVDLLLLTGVDVTDARVAQAQLAQRMAADQEQAERDRDHARAGARTTTAFLANMSHEIRTPMNAVIGFTSLLLGTELDAQQRDFAQTIRASGEHLLGLIDDILDFSKLDAGEMALSPTPMSLRGLIGRSLELIEPAARGKGLWLRTEIQPGVPDRLVADERRLRQILLNLAGNAVKFTESGGILVGADVQRGVSGGRLAISVQDTGPGIEPPDLERLFEPFRQGDATMSRRHGGTGLGLAISRRLARAMGGDITAASVPGRGTCFTVVIDVGVAGGTGTDGVVPTVPTTPPARVPTVVNPPPPARPPAAASSASSASSSEPIRILVAEDSAVNQKVVVLSLRQLGYDADVVANGREAVEAVLRTPYDVVLMDVQMPIMDGLDATRAIHARLPPRSRPRIVAVTAHALESDRARCLEAGMDDYVSKPLRPGELRRVLGVTPALPALPAR